MNTETYEKCIVPECEHVLHETLPQCVKCLAFVLPPEDTMFLGAIRKKLIRENRSRYDAGRKRSGKSGKSGKRKAPPVRDNNLVRPILAIDGEGVTDADGKHRYIMLAASNGEYISNESLSTAEIFSFLLRLPKRHLIVGFSINYDICKWLQYLRKKDLQQLWTNGYCTWGEYRIRWAQSKQITIRRGKESVHIYDVFGFFQHSFVASLQEWKVGTPEQIDRIQTMKESRGTFTDEARAEMLAYCLEECELLVQLVGKLRDALIEGEIPVSQWYGAGAIATAIFRKENTKRYMQRQPPPAWERAVLGSYFGGRFELRYSGEWNNVYTYDIRSAYPHIARGLPCQSHMVFSHHTGYIDAEWCIYYISWKVPENTPWPPFPFRIQGSRQIIFPTNGYGFYHASEVRAAMALFPNCITVHETYLIETYCQQNSCDGVPFSFVPPYFAFRDELKKRGSQAQLTIKLGLNSLYGKTAQGVGFGDKKPPYQSYLWAGMITAGTRAMILDAIRQKPDSVLWIACDGIVSTEPLNVNCGDDLGEWEDGTADSVFCVQTGVYEVVKDGEVTVRSRGFGKRETDFDSIKRAFADDPVGGKHSYTVTRFIGLGGALARKEFWQHFGRWKEVTRELNFSQVKRFAACDLDGSEPAPPILWLPPAAPTDQPESAPYVPRTSWTDLWEREASDESLDLLIDSEQP